jgi:predicted DNA binding CopG/RHH family protein
MPRRLKPIPKFANEAQERAFWESHDTTDYVDWSRAKVVSFPNLKPSTKTISLRLPEDVLNTIRSHANKLDVPYQSLMKLWLAEKAAQAARTREPKARSAR